MTAFGRLQSKKCRRARLMVNGNESLNFLFDIAGMADDQYNSNVFADGDSIAETLPAEAIDLRYARRAFWITLGGAFAAVEILLLLIVIVPSNGSFVGRLLVFLFFTAIVELVLGVVVAGVCILSLIKRRTSPPDDPLTIGVRDGGLFVATPRNTRRLSAISECWWYLGRANAAGLAFTPRDCVLLVLPGGERQLPVGWTAEAKENWMALLKSSGARRWSRPGPSWVFGLYTLCGVAAGALLGIGANATIQWLAPGALQGTWWSLPVALAACGGLLAALRAAVCRFPWFRMQPMMLVKGAMAFAVIGFIGGFCAGLRFECGLITAAAFLMVGGPLLTIVTNSTWPEESTNHPTDS